MFGRQRELRLSGAEKSYSQELTFPKPPEPPKMRQKKLK